jgi:hypothetical protein
MSVIAVAQSSYHCGCDDCGSQHHANKAGEREPNQRCGQYLQSAGNNTPLARVAPLYEIASRPRRADRVHEAGASECRD